ncbi:protein belonging to Uncharacterized protein family UPF0118, partial [mine drainage metagenome]
GKTVFSGFVSLLTILFLTLFLLLEAPRLVRAVLDWMQPERASRVQGVLDDIGRAIVGYMLGNLLTSLIAGVVVGVALYAMGVPYVEVLALWVALVDFLPLIGGLLAGVPTVVVASLHSLTGGGCHPHRLRRLPRGGEPLPQPTRDEPDSPAQLRSGC